MPGGDRARSLTPAAGGGRLAPGRTTQGAHTTLRPRYGPVHRRFWSLHARLSSPLKGPTRLIHEDHSAFSGTFGPSRIRGRQSTLDAEQQALAHSATSNPDLHRRLPDVSYTSRVSTGARDIDAALVAACTQTRSMPSVPRTPAVVPSRRVFLSPSP
ncbi:DUF5133 domain-containing protein [Streptomyces sp. DSM 41987]|uniref:DUF5133 domain-containing protein n=1 Tax=Streptomyces sp. DSM 41987 TaxID=3418993 RepID=UPI003D0775E1